MRAMFVDTKVGPGHTLAYLIRHFPQPTPLTTDVHQSFEVGIVTAGRVVRRFDDLGLSQGPGDVWLHAAWEPHEWRVVAPDTRLAAVFFLPEFLGEQTHGVPDWLALFAARPRVRPQVSSPTTRNLMLTIAEEFAEETEQRRTGWEIAVRLALLRLLHTLGREWEPEDPAARRQPVQLGDLTRIMPAIHLLGDGPTHHVTLEEAADACRLSISQFRAVFLRTVGLSFGKFCLRARLAHIAHRLLTTDLPLAKLAEEADFSDASHLHHAFTSKYGRTPAQFRHEGLEVGSRESKR